MREKAVLKADNMNMRKLQALATVDCNQRDGVAGVFLLLLAIGIQAEVVLKILQLLFWIGRCSGERVG